VGVRSKRHDADEGLTVVGRAYGEKGRRLIGRERRCTEGGEEEEGRLRLWLEEDIVERMGERLAEEEDTERVEGKRREDLGCDGRTG